MKRQCVLVFFLGCLAFFCSAQKRKSFSLMGRDRRANNHMHFLFVFVQFFSLFTVCYWSFKYHWECFRKVSWRMGQKAMNAKL